MDWTDTKVFTANVTALSINLTSVDKILSVTLLLLSIGYTLYKWHSLAKQNKKK